MWERGGRQREEEQWLWDGIRVDGWRNGRRRGRRFRRRRRRRRRRLVLALASWEKLPTASQPPNALPVRLSHQPQARPAATSVIWDQTSNCEPTVWLEPPVLKWEKQKKWTFGNLQLLSKLPILKGLNKFAWKSKVAHKSLQPTFGHERHRQDPLRKIFPSEDSTLCRLLSEEADHAICYCYCYLQSPSILFTL